MKRSSFLKSLFLLPIMSKINNINQLNDFLPQDLTISDQRMPVLFLGHGSPMNAIEDNEFVRQFQSIGRSLPTPKAIICISAHWFTKGTFVTAMKRPQTIHDFGGFPEELFKFQYPVNGSPELAAQTKDILQPMQVSLDQDWGLDHGAWSVLTHLYPKGDVPVIQLSIDYTQSPVFHFELAQKLSTLRDKGILIIGSGNIIHNLRLADFNGIHKIDYGYDWALESHEILNKYILDSNYNPLINYKDLTKSVHLAIPTPEHYLPLIYTLALKDKKDNVTLFNDKLLAGSLSMTSVRIG